MMPVTLQPGIHITRVGVRTVHFVHKSDAAIEIGVNDRHEILLGIEQTADPATFRVVAGIRTPKDHPGPYRFEIVMEADVRADDNSAQTTLEYAKQHGWALLFPFIRERLADLSSRGRAGAYYLPPTNVAALVVASEMQRLGKQEPEADEEVTPPTVTTDG